MARKRDMDFNVHIVLPDVIRFLWSGALIVDGMVSRGGRVHPTIITLSVGETYCSSTFLGGL